jgi:NAD(P)-dependent dehydrogenase (short-subunit alcohol dehydrogenase family)
MDLELAGRVAIVTGGGTGIGKEVARVLAQEGCNVVICARRIRALESAAAEISAETSAHVLPLLCDTNDMASVARMVSEGVARFGTVDILVNSAAAPSGLVRNDIEHAGDDALLDDLNTKVVGYFRCSKAVVPQMRRNGFGRIINIGGLTGRASKVLSGMRNLAVADQDAVGSARTRWNYGQSPPSGSCGNRAHHDVYVREAAEQGKTAREANQGYVDATPIRRVLQPREIGWLVAFLASPKSGAITGEPIDIDGGMSRGIFL